MWVSVQPVPHPYISSLCCTVRNSQGKQHIPHKPQRWLVCPPHLSSFVTMSFLLQCSITHLPATSSADTGTGITPWILHTSPAPLNFWIKTGIWVFLVSIWEFEYAVPRQATSISILPSLLHLLFWFFPL